MDPFLESDFNFKRYINTIKINFTPKCVETLNEVDQVYDLFDYHKAQKSRINTLHEKTQKAIQKEVETVNTLRDTGY